MKTHGTVKGSWVVAGRTDVGEVALARAQVEVELLLVVVLEEEPQVRRHQRRHHTRHRVRARNTAKRRSCVHSSAKKKREVEKKKTQRNATAH